MPSTTKSSLPENKKKCDNRGSSTSSNSGSGNGKRRNRCSSILFVFFLAVAACSIIPVASTSNSIPRSNNRYTNYFNIDGESSIDDSSLSISTSSSSLYHPPWNPSTQINSEGFLNEYYSRVPGSWESSANIRGKHGVSNRGGGAMQIQSVPVQVRQVPGDGNCLFHSIAICLFHAANNNNCDGEDGYWECLGLWRKRNRRGGEGNTKDDDISYQRQRHLPMDTMANIAQLRRTSLALRNAAVDVLSCSSSPTTAALSSLISTHKGVGVGGGLLGLGGLGSLISRGGGGVASIMGNAGGKTATPPSRLLFLQGDEYISSTELLAAASSQFNIDGEEYCTLMRNEGYWGGGPEIVALCNYLRRPIHVYELVPKNNDNSGHHTHNDSDGGKVRTSDRFALRRMACFGSPKFDRKSPLLILSADSRFPDLEPKRARRAGNHFLALFEVPRGGGGYDSTIKGG